ncbi:hypothetical protein ACFLU2_03395, partial [Chloroflexota bacterium]
IRKAGFALSPPEYVSLTDNQEAKNPTFSQLIAFLYNDPTDDEYYSILSFNCTGFAEMLHNNAEAAGIKAAFVAVYFEGEDTGHALNAFVTSDKGLVYVDCTGEGLGWYGYTIEYDGIAHVFKGEEYRRWSINKYTFVNYRYYEPYRQTSDWEEMGIVESIKIYW